MSNPQMLLLSSTPPSIDPECSESGPRLKTQDWANAAEFVPGQPYCGRGEWQPRFYPTRLLIRFCISPADLFGGADEAAFMFLGGSLVNRVHIRGSLSLWGFCYFLLTSGHFVNVMCVVQLSR